MYYAPSIMRKLLPYLLVLQTDVSLFRLWCEEMYLPLLWNMKTILFGSTKILSRSSVVQLPEQEYSEEEKGR